MSLANADGSGSVIDISVIKHFMTASRWLRKVREVLSRYYGGVGVVYTSGRGVLMGRKTSTKEGDGVGCWSVEKGFKANCKSYYGLFDPYLAH